MAASYVNRFLPTFKLILRTKNSNLSDIIGTLENSQIKFIVECGYNILKGVLPLQGSVLETAKRNKFLFKQLVSRKLSLKQKRVLLQRNPKFVKSIIRTVLSVYSYA